MTFSWRSHLLSERLSPLELEALPARVQTCAREFLDTPPPPHTSLALTEANAWYNGEGHQVLAEMASVVWDHMTSQAAHAMPAHDARHAMYKVPAAALRHMHAERVEGYERCGVLGALLHDYGRWAEERLYGGPGNSALHARFSFLLTQDLLKQYDIPELVRYSLLLAPLRHTTGAEPNDPMPLKLTVAGDRDQLYGPEIVIRLAHHAIDETFKQTCFYGEVPGTPILNRLQHFHNNRLPGPLFALEPAILELQTILRNFLLMAEPYEVSKERWKDSSRTVSTKAAPPIFNELKWNEAWHAAQAHAAKTANSGSAHCALKTLLSAPHLASAPGYLQEALGKVSHVPPAWDPLLAAAFDYVHSERIRLDTLEVAELEKIAEQHSGDQLVSALCSRIGKGLLTLE